MPNGCYLCGHLIVEHTNWLYPPGPDGRGCYWQQAAWCPDCIRCCPPVTTSEGGF